MLINMTIDSKYEHMKIIFNLIVKKRSIVKQGIAKFT